GHRLSQRLVAALVGQSRRGGARDHRDRRERRLQAAQVPPPHARTIPAVSGAGSVTTGGPGARAVRNSLLVLGARVVSRLVALVMVVVLANHRGDARDGRYTTMVAYSSVVAVLADLGLNTLYTREAA